MTCRPRRCSNFCAERGYPVFEVEGASPRTPEAIAREIQGIHGAGVRGPMSGQESGMIVRKNMAELEKMRAAGLLVWKILDKLKGMVRGGCDDLRSGSGRGEDDAMRARAGVQGLFDAGRRRPKFPFVLCTSVNDEIVHGMPSQKRVLKRAISCRSNGRAVGRILRRFGGDGADRRNSEETKRLLEVTRESLELAIERRGRATGCSIFAGRWSGT